MSLDAHLLFAILCVFCRCTAMLFSAPLLSTAVPVMIRVLTGVVLTLSLVPVLQSSVGPVPGDMVSLVLTISREVLIGLLIGGFLQILCSTAQMAGTFIDVQIGTGSAQILNPTLGTTASPVSQLKMMLVTVMVFILNGHRMMLGAFVKSYSLPGPTHQSVEPELFGMLGQVAMLSLQIAAPVAAVTIVIDLAAGLVNKAVPQTQPFLLSLPAKLAAGIVILALGLPALTGAVQTGLDFTFEHLGHALGGK